MPGPEDNGFEPSLLVFHTACKPRNNRDERLLLPEARACASRERSCASRERLRAMQAVIQASIATASATCIGLGDLAYCVLLVQFARTYKFIPDKNKRLLLDADLARH